VYLKFFAIDGNQQVGVIFSLADKDLLFENAKDICHIG